MGDFGRYQHHKLLIFPTKTNKMLNFELNACEFHQIYNLDLVKLIKNT